jgi:hypothetical protein
VARSVVTQFSIFTRERLQSYAVIHLALLLWLLLPARACFVVAVVVDVVACLLVLYSMKQFENLPLQQGSHARMQFGILPQQQGNARSLVVWRMQSCNGRQAVMSAAQAAKITFLAVYSTTPKFSTFLDR